MPNSFYFCAVDTAKDAASIDLIVFERSGKALTVTQMQFSLSVSIIHIK